MMIIKHYSSSVVAVTLISLVGLAIASGAAAQTSDAATRFVEVAGGYRLVPDITYVRAGGVDLKLDLY